MEGRTFLRSGRLDGLYQGRVRLIWDNWRHSRLRKFVLVATALLTMSLTAVFPGQILGESGAGSPNRLWSSGAELNSLTANMEATGSSGTVSISSSTVRSGSYAYRANPTSSTGVIFKTWANSTQTNKFWFRTYFRIATAPSADTYIFRVGSGTNGKISVRLTSSSTLQLRNEEDNANIGSASSALSTNTWYRLEVYVDTTTLSSTDAEMRLDGVSIASSTSEDLAAGIDRLTWGVLNTATADLFFDDIAINDSTGRGDNWPGEGKIVHMLPNADGDSTQWSRGGTDSGANWSQVDEITPNDNTDYVATQTSNHVDDYNIVSASSVGIGNGDLIKMVSVGARVRVCGTTGGPACFFNFEDVIYRTRIKAEASGTVEESADIGIDDSDTTWYTNDDDTAKLNKLTMHHRPGTTAAWTAAYLDSAQIGIKYFTGNGYRLTAIWLQVEYVPAGGGRIFSSGFELNSATAGMEWTSFAGSPTIVTSPVRSGTYALQTASGGAQSFAQYHFAAANQDGPYFVRVYARVAETPESEFNIIELRDTSNNARAYITLDGSRQLRLYDEDGVIGSASSALSTATWYRLEIEFSTVPSAGSHVIKARVDGSEFAAATNRNISTGIARLAIGSNINVGDVDAGQLQYDDIAINTNFGATQNSYPGEGKIVHLRPNAAGDNSGWTTNGTCTGGNFGCVNEATPNDSTNYVSSTAANTIDDYNIGNPSFGSSADINVVSVGVRFNSASATQESFRVRLKDSSGGVPIESPNLSPASTTWVTNQTAEPRNYPLTAYTRPEQSTPWTKTVLDNSQIGVRNVLNGTGTAQVTALWLLVEYDEPVISISGRVFTDEGSTGLNCITPRTVRVKVNGAGDYAASCSNSPSNGSYTVSGISITAAGDVLTVFLDGATEKAVTVSRAADTSSNITGFDLYQNRVIVRHEDAGPLSIANLDQYDSGNDADIQFTADTGNEPHTLTVASGAKLLVWTGKTFTPGGTVTTTTGATPSGDVLIQSSAVLNMGGNALSIGGSYQNSGTFTSGSNTTTFTSTSTGKTLGGTMTSSSAFYNVVFNGSGGGWTLSADFEATNNFSITNGTFDTHNSGNYAVTVGGNLTGNSGTWTLQMRGSTWTVSGNWDTSAVATDYDNIVRGSSTLVMNGSGTKTLKTGSTDIWRARFHNLTVAQGSGKTTQLQQSVGFSGVLTVGSGGDGTFDLNNFIIYAAESTTASPLSLNGTFGTGNGTLSFWGNINKNLPGHTYNSNYTNELSTGFKLTQQGAVTFTGNFTLGCCSRASEHDTNNYNLTVNGSVTWDTTTAILTAGSSTINVGNDWNNANAAVFNAGTSTVNFNKASGTQTLTSGGTGSTKRFYNLTHSGAGTLSLATHAVEIQNDLSNSGGTMSGSVNVTVNGHATGVGAITMSGSSTFTQRVSADKNFGTTSGSAAWSFVNLTFASDGSIDTITTQSGGSGAINISGNMRVGVSGDAGRTILNAGSRTWALSGTGGNPLNTDEDGNGSRITAATSTFTFTGNNSGGNTTIEANANGGGYYNLTVGCLGLCTAEIYELEAATVVANNLVIQDSDTGTNTLDTVSGQNYALTIGNNWTNNDAFTARSGTVTFNATDTGNTLSGTLSGSSAFYNLTFNGSGGEWTPSAAVAVTNDLTMTAGTLLGTQNITVNGHAVGTGGIINLTGGTFEQRPNNPRNFGTSSGSAAWTFNNLTFSNSNGGAEADITITTQTGGTGGINITGVLTVGLGGDINKTTLSAGNRTWTLSGTGGDPFQLTASRGFLTASTSTFTYTGNNGSGDTTVQVATYNHLIINNGSETYNLEGNTSAGGNVTITAGTLALNGFTLTITGDLSVSGTLSGSTNVTVSGGDATGDGIINLTGGTFNIRGTGNFGGDTDWIFSILTIGSSGGGTTISATGSGGMTVSASLSIIGSTISGNTLNAGAKTWTLSGTGGNPLNSGGCGVTPANSSLNPQTSTFVFTGNNGSGNTNIHSSYSYNNLIVNNGSETFDLCNNTTVNGNLTITAGTLDAVSGQNYSLTVGGNLSNSGTFTARNGTVTLNGSSTQTVSGTWTGSSSFYNLTITNNSGASATSCERDGFTASVDFNVAATVSNNFTITTANVRIEYNSGSTYTFTNINWNGQAAGTRIYFRNSAASGTWLLNVSGTQTAVSYVNVSRSDASGGDTINAADGTNVDCGNNVNWSFAAPNSPVDLAQKKTDNTVIAAGGWTNETFVKFTANVSDPDNPASLQLCVERDLLGTDFSGTEDACGSFVSYSGTPVEASVTISVNDNQQYHWQARVRDSGGSYSAWVCFGTCSNSTRDFGVDTTAPTTGTVYDGDQTGVDADYNDGSLTALSANWDGFDASVSGLLRYDYSIGTSQGGTDIKNWTDNGTSTSVTATSLKLRTNQRYYFNVRAVDNAGNTSNVVSSDGQDVLPSISMSLSTLTLTFDTLNAGNDRSDTKTVTITSSTNGHGGYVVRQYASGLLTADSFTIPMFEGGTYSSPASWPTPCSAGSNCGYGYTSSDTSIQGSNLFNNGTLFAAFAVSPFGDIVCDNTGPITGTSGPIVNEQHTITHKVAVSALQAARIYQTQVTYVITGTF